MSLAWVSNSMLIFLILSLNSDSLNEKELKLLGFYGFTRYRPLLLRSAKQNTSAVGKSLQDMTTSSDLGHVPGFGCRM